MDVSLRDLEVLVLDCQAGGATPVHGDLLELGWAVCGRSGIMGGVRDHWIVPRTERRVPRPIRELTGWSEACVAEARTERAVWQELLDEVRRLSDAASPGSPPVPTVIHYARFELPFLRDLHARLGEVDEFPFDALCLHAVAARLYPDLPRRNIRALAGFLGHSTDLLRRSAGHVEATAFIWQALLPELERAGVASWNDLRRWVAEAPPSVRRDKRVYPLALERRRALPDRPGVYRFVRRNGDLLYVGKAASLRKRVASHFAGRARTTERGLELLTQVHDIVPTETASVLEAALLESDEIKRLDPPYNVQLRGGERQAWFVSSDLWDAVPAPDASHRVGPLPSSRATASIAALVALAAGASPSAQLRAIALAVPTVFLPDDALFSEGWQAFAAEHLGEPLPRKLRLARDDYARVDRASRALWLARGRAEPQSSDDRVEEWDLARVRRRLERSLVQGGLLIRRARWLCLLSGAELAFRERGMSSALLLALSRCEVVERCELPHVSAIARRPVKPWLPHAERQAAFDAIAYDRLRVLATELQRVRDEGGELALRLGKHVYSDSRLLQLMRMV